MQGEEKVPDFEHTALEVFTDEYSEKLENVSQKEKC